MKPNLKFFLIAVITIGCIYLLFFNRPKYSFTIPEPMMLMFFRSGCISPFAEVGPWGQEDFCTIAACHDDNYDENSCSKIEPLLKLAQEFEGPDGPSPFGRTISEFEAALEIMESAMSGGYSGGDGYSGGNGYSGDGTVTAEVAAAEAAEAARVAAAQAAAAQAADAAAAQAAADAAEAARVAAAQAAAAQAAADAAAAGTSGT